MKILTKKQIQKKKPTKKKKADDKLNGLKNFSRLVSDKVKSKGSTTYNEVADDLCKELNNDIDSKKYKEKSL